MGDSDRGGSRSTSRDRSGSESGNDGAGSPSGSRDRWLPGGGSVPLSRLRAKRRATATQSLVGTAAAAMLMLVVASAAVSAGPLAPDDVRAGVDDVATSLGVNEPSTDRIDEQEVERLVHTYINQKRFDHSLTALEYDHELSQVAATHSRDMASRSYLAHETPEGLTVTDRYERHRYNCLVATEDGGFATGAENLDRTYFDTVVETDRGYEHYKQEEELARAIVADWMGSEEHRDNLLNPVWERQGLGVEVTVEDGRIAVYVTQNFC